jgi:hypothetical protein
MARVANDIVASRLARSKLGTEIKATTRLRHDDVHSFLKEAKAGRGAATSAQAAEGKRMTAALHSEVRSMLSGFKTTRRLATRGYRKEAAATTKARQKEVNAMKDGFARDAVARTRQREENAQAQREQSALFRKELTNSVDVFRDFLAKNGRDRAAEIRDNFASYANDRREGTAIWTETLRKTRPVKAPQVPATQNATAPLATAWHQDKPKARQQQGRQRGRAN